MEALRRCVLVGVGQLSLVIHFLGIACAAPSLRNVWHHCCVPDAIFALTGHSHALKCSEVLVGTMEASPLPHRWNPSYLHFAGFILLVLRAFTVLIVGVKIS
jgi:hypothetical protein